MAALCGLALVLLHGGGCGSDEEASSATAMRGEAPATESAEEPMRDAPESAEPAAEAVSAEVADPAEQSEPVASAEAARETASLRSSEVPEESASACITRILENVREAYAQLEIADVIMHERTTMGGAEMPRVRHLARFGSRELAYIEDQWSRLRILDGTMFYQHINRPRDFARIRYSGDLSDAIGAFRSASILPIAMYAGRDLDFIMPIFRFGGSAELRPESCRLVTDHEGRRVYRLHLTGSEADTRIDVDPETWHFTRIVAAFRLPEDIILDYERIFDFELIEYDALPEAITFDTEGLDEWPTIQAVTRTALRPAAPITGPVEPMEPGEQATSFELRTLYGRTYRYEPDGTHYTMLAFWSARHSETLRFLAEMQSLQRWFDEEGTAPGRVVTVNSLDGRPALERFDATFDFWDARDWGMPALFDDGDQVARAYRISPIPAAVLIAPDGEVLGVWNGQSRGYQITVRNLVQTHEGDRAPEP